MNLPAPNWWEIHPALVHFPIALILAGVAVDFLARNRPELARTAIGLLIAGVLLGWLAAAAGLLSFYTVPAHTEEAHSLMWWHLGFALSAMLVFTWVVIKRRKERESPARGSLHLAEIFGALLLLTTGYLGGVIVYHGGAGINPEILSEEIRAGHSHNDSEENRAKTEGEHSHREGEHEHE